MFAQVSPVRKAPHEVSCTRGAGPPLLLTLHPPGTRPSFVKWTVANVESCKFPDWQKVFLFIFSPSFHCFILKKKVQERKYLAQSESCALGAVKLYHPRPPSVSSLPTLEPGRFFWGRWCVGSHTCRLAAKAPGREKGPGGSLPPTQNQDGSSTGQLCPEQETRQGLPPPAPGSLCLRKTREERVGHPQCGRTVTCFFFFLPGFCF